MSRVIKFRAWSVNSETMLTLCPGGRPFTGVDLLETNSWKVMQFTGLHDRNGVEIYEGDVIECPHFKDAAGRQHKLRHIVEWSDKYHGWFLLSVSSMNTEDGSIQLFVARHGDIVVAGNIYANPELLEGEKV